MSENGSGNAMRIFRLFELLDELRLRHTPVTAHDLAADMGVSLRTIYRDIADLQAMGAPIRGEGGVGYVMEPGYFMPSLSFDDEELAAIALGIRMVMTRSDAGLSAAASRAAAKVASAVNRDARHGFLEGSLHAGPSEVSRTPFLRDLREAIGRRSILRINYTSRSGKTSQRDARPLGLTLFDSAWLLTIWCETAQDFRHLRVDCIDAVQPTGSIFRDERGKRFADCLAREGNPAGMKRKPEDMRATS